MGMKLADMFVRIGADVSGFSRGLEKAQKSLGTIGASMQRAGQAMTLAITAPMLGVAAAGLTLVAGFEAGMNKVKAVSGATGSAFEALELQARNLGKTTKFTAAEAADAMGFLAMAGFETEQIMGSMTDTLNLAAAANIDLASSADIVSNILTGYGLEVEDLAAATDTLATVMSSANTDLTQLGVAFKYVGPVASGVGLKFNEMAAAIGMLGNAGIQGSMAGTSLRKIITSLLGPSKEGAKIMKKYGISILDAAGNMLPLADITEQFEESFDKVGTSVEHASDMMELIGQRGGPAMISIIDQGAEAMRKLEKKSNDAAGAVKTMAEVMMKGLQGSITKMKSALSDAGISLGQILAPHAEALTKLVIKLANKFSELATSFKELPAPVQQAALALAAFAAALGPVLMVTGMFLTQMSGFKLLIPMFSKIGGSFTSFGGTIAKVALLIKGLSFAAMWASIKAAVVAAVAALSVLSGGTIALVIAAIVALGAALFVVIKYWRNVKDVAMSFGRDLAGIFNKVVGVIANFGKSVAKVFGAIGSWIVKWVVKIFGKEFFDRIVRVWNGLVSFFKNSWKKITGFFEGGFGKIVAMAGKLAEKLGLQETADAFARWKLELDLAAEGAHDFVGPMQFIGPIAEKIVDQVEQIPEPIAAAAKEATKFGQALSEAGTATEKVLSKIPKTFDDLVAAVRKAESRLLPFWQNVSDKAMEHRKAVEDQLAVYDKLGVVAGPAIDRLRKELVKLDEVMEQIEQHSLDEEFKALQQSMETGLLESIKTLATELQATGGILDDLANEKFKGLNEAIELADKGMKEFGITSTDSINKIINGLEAQRDAMEDSWKAGTHSAADYWRLVIKSLEKQVELTRQLGRETSGLEEEISAAAAALDETGVGFKKVEKNAQQAGFVMKQVSTIVDDLSKGIADAILEGENFGEILVSVFEQAGKAVLRFAVETIAKTLINSLLTAEGAVASLSKAFDGLMNGITKLIGGGAPGAPAGSTDGVLGSLMGGPLGMLGSLGTVISSIIQNFQSARMEKTLNAIEENTRYIKIWTGEQEFSIQKNTAKTREGIGYLNASADDIKTTLWKISETLLSGIFVQDGAVAREIIRSGDQVSDDVKAAAESASKGAEDVVEAVDIGTTATMATEDSIDSQTGHIIEGFEELKTVQQRASELIRELGTNVDKWGGVMDQVASGMVGVANAVDNQTRSLNSLIGSGGPAAGLRTGGTSTGDAVQLKQLFYLRFLQNLDVPLSGALAFLEKTLVNVGQQLSEFEPIDKKNVDEYEALQKELRALQKKEGKLQKDFARIQAIEARLLELDEKNLLEREALRDDELTSANQYGRDLDTAAGVVTSGSNRLREAGTAAGAAINESFNSVTKAVQDGAGWLAQGAVATVGQISSTYGSALRDIQDSPYVAAPSTTPFVGKDPWVTHTGIIGINAAPQFPNTPSQQVNLFVDVNNADAKKVANEMIETWRTHGVDI